MLGKRKPIKAEDVDEDVLEQYARAVTKQHAKMDEQVKKAAAWPKIMKAAVADIKLSIKGNPNVKRTVAQLDSKKPTYLYDILDKLQSTYGDKHEDQKVDVLLAHIFLIFSSGDTAEVHADKVRTSLAEVEKVCGSSMTMDKLTSVLFESHLRLFDVFKIVSQSIAQLSAEASLEDKLKIFEDAMRSEEEINIPREDLQRAVQALVVKVFKDVKVPKAARGDGGGRGRGYGRGARATPRAQANLGGAAPDEGVLAFFSQNDKGGKGGGRGNPHANNQTRKTPSPGVLLKVAVSAGKWVTSPENVAPRLMLSRLTRRRRRIIALGLCGLVVARVRRLHAWQLTIVTIPRSALRRAMRRVMQRLCSTTELRSAIFSTRRYRNLSCRSRLTHRLRPRTQRRNDMQDEV